MRRTIVAWTGMALLLAAACGGPERVSREALVEVPQPDLSSFDPAVRERIARARAELGAMLQASRPVDDAELADLFGRLGSLYHAWGLDAAAEAAYRNAETLDPAAYRWPYLLGSVLRMESRPADAAEAFGRALAVRGDDVPALVQLAETELERGDSDGARRHFEQALERDPDCAPAHAGLGKLALEHGDDAAALEHLEAARRLAPGATSLDRPLADARQRAGGDAGSDAGAAAAAGQGGNIPVPLRDPLMEEIRALRGGLSGSFPHAASLAADGSLDDAEAELRKAVEQNPGDPVAQAGLGQVLAEAGRLDEARAALEAALAIEPADTVAHYNLGVVLARSGRDEAAVGQFEAALALRPESSETRVALGDALRRLGRFEPALEAYHHAAETDPTSRGAVLGEVLTLMRLHRWKDALDKVDAARSVWPDDQDLRHVEVRLLAAAPDPDVRDGAKAVELARGLMRSNMPIDQLEAAAMAAAAGGRWADAVRLQEQVLRAAARIGPQGVAEIRHNLERYREKKLAARPWPDDSPVLSPPTLGT